MDTIANVHVHTNMCLRLEYMEFAEVNRGGGGGGLKSNTCMRVLCAQRVSFESCGGKGLC